jgi:hypothetical protein
MTPPADAPHGDAWAVSTRDGGPPHDVEAERAILGAMMLSPDVITDIAEAMSPADHYRPAHETIHRAIIALHEQGKPVDPITLAHYLARAGDLDRVGGAACLHAAVNAVPTTTHGEYYAEIVHELAERRRLIQAGTRLVQAASAPDATADDVREALALGNERLPEEWPAPIPLHARPAPAPFPVKALPPWLAEFTAAVAEETQTPVDLAGSLALSVLAAACGGRIVVQVRGRWCEPTNLYVVVALPPANRKSAVFAAMTGPLYEAESQLATAAAARIVEADLTAKIARESAEKAAAKAAACDGPERDNLVAEAVWLAKEAEALTVPSRPRLLADDATPEVVASLLSEQGGRLAVMSAEGGIFDIIAGRYSGSPNMEVFLKAHSGDRLRIDRRTREEYVEAPALTMGLAVQPTVLEDIGKHRGFDGRGLLARFLYCLPLSLVGHRKINPTPVPPDIAARYEANILGLTLSLADWTDPAALHLSSPAADVLTAYEERIEPQLRAKGGRLGHITKWAGKLVGAAARVAGLLHMATHLQSGHAKPISDDTMTAAVALADYYADHALTVFDLMGADAVHARARALLDVLIAHGWSNIGRRDLFAKLSRSEFPTVEALEPAVALLEDHGYLRTQVPQRTGKRGRPPAPRYLIHPQLREGRA